MNIVDISEARKKRGDLSLVWFDEDEGADIKDIVMLTVDGGVVMLTHPKEMKGVHLSAEQAQELGVHLIRASVRAEQITEFNEEE